MFVVLLSASKAVHAAYMSKIHQRLRHELSNAKRYLHGSSSHHIATHTPLLIQRLRIFDIGILHRLSSHTLTPEINVHKVWSHIVHISAFCQSSRQK